MIVLYYMTPFMVDHYNIQYHFNKEYMCMQLLVHTVPHESTDIRFIKSFICSKFMYILLMSSVPWGCMFCAMYIQRYTFEVWEWITYFIAPFTGHAITNPCGELQLTHVCKGPPDDVTV